MTAETELDLHAAIIRVEQLVCELPYSAGVVRPRHVGDTFVERLSLAEQNLRAVKAAYMADADNRAADEADARKYAQLSHQLRDLLRLP